MAAEPDKPLAITPHTTVGDLLAAYPELEAVLIARSPAFARLKNPVLRRTIAKVATLAQAANIAVMPPVDLVNELRRAVGQEALHQGRASLHPPREPLHPGRASLKPVQKPADLESASSDDAVVASSSENAFTDMPPATAIGSAPPWFDPKRVTAEIDADALLGRDENPAGEVFRQAAVLGPADILAVRSAFLPAPLIAALRGRGYECWTIEERSDRFLTLVRRLEV